MNPLRKPVAASKVEGNRFHVSFDVIEDDKYRLIVVDDRGRRNEESIFYPIKALKDKLPVVKISKPGKNITAVKTTEIPLTIEVSDDFGVAELGLAYKIKTNDEKRFVMKKFDKNTKSFKHDDTFFLELLKLADTDVVSYYAYAKDNDAVTGPKESVSDLYFIEIEPFGQQYQYAPDSDLAEKGGDGKKKEDLAQNVEKMIQRQQQVLKKTFNVDRIPKEERDEGHVTLLKDLASEENDLRKSAEALANDLAKRLYAAGAQEQMDRADNLVKAAAQLGLAAFVLESLDSKAALSYENAALYHLYRAKRDMLILISLAKSAKDPELRKKLRQALELAFKKQQSLEELQRQQQLKELREKIREMASLQEQQKQMNQELKQQAAEAAKSGQKPSESQGQKMDQLAEKQKKMQQKAAEQADKLRNMDFENPRQSYKAAKATAEAAMEMEETARSLQERKPAEARDHGVKAEKNLERALREARRALERTVKDQLRAAAEEAERLAQEQRDIREQAEKQLASAQQQQQQAKQDEAEPQAASEKKPGPQQGTKEGPKEGETQPQPAARKKQGAQEQTPAQPGPGEKKTPQKGEADMTAAQGGARKRAGDRKPSSTGEPKRPAEASKRAVAERKGGEQKTAEGKKTSEAAKQPSASASGQARAAAELVERQKRAAEEFDELGKRVRAMAPKVAEVDPEIGRGVEQVAQKITKGDIQKQMKAAAEAMEQGRASEAKKTAKTAENQMKPVADELKELSRQFEMDDTRRLANAAAKARALTKKQDEINEGMKRLASAEKKPAAEQPNADKAQANKSEKPGKQKAAAGKTAETAEKSDKAGKQPARGELRKQQAEVKKQTEELANEAWSSPWRRRRRGWNRRKKS